MKLERVGLTTKVSNGLDARLLVDTLHFSAASDFPRHTECI